MNNMEQESRLNETELMNRILEVRYTDLEEEVRLCKQLLGIAEPWQDNYICAFAHVYLMDGYLALGKYGSCNFHLIRASMLCEKYGYDDLTVSLYNFAGLYYFKLNDEQTAIGYYLKGIELAEKLSDEDILSKLLNNIGLAFGNRGDWLTAKQYFERAFATIEPYIKEGAGGNAVSYLSNLAEMCNMLNDSEGMKETLLKCDSLIGDSLYQKIRIGVAWLSYYEKIGDAESAVKEIDRLMDMGMLEFENKYFVCDMLEGVCEALMKMGDLKRAKSMLDILCEFEKDASLVNRYNIQLIKIKYSELVKDDALMLSSLREYYDIMRQMSEIEDSARVQSMISKIELTKAQTDYEAVYSQNRELERMSQMDELTGLYNRRYLSKLITKTLQRGDLKSLGYIMLDVDYFKQYNDFYGHFEGDKVLVRVARAIAQSADENIYTARYGGDEFVCLCVNKTDEQMAEYAKSVCENIAAQGIDHEKSLCCDKLTVSIGYHNEAAGEGMKPEHVLNMADKALYKVKLEGRNGVSGI